VDEAIIKHVASVPRMLQLYVMETTEVKNIWQNEKHLIGQEHF
jgi:hypothetical protein